MSHSAGVSHSQGHNRPNLKGGHLSDVPLCLVSAGGQRVEEEEKERSDDGGASIHTVLNV